MKKFNCIVFLCSFLMVGIITAMEKEKKSIGEGNWYIELDKKQNAQIVKHVGGKVGYYYQYDAQCNNDSMLFPIKLVDLLPIRYCGDKKFFITSATEVKKGSALTILDPAVTQLAVVRGFCNKNRCKVNLYLGLESDKFDTCGHNKRDRIYPARIMTLQISNWDVKYAPVKQEVEDFEVMTEIRQALDKQKESKSPLYTYQIKMILGICGMFTDKYFDFEKECFKFDENYWPDKEHKSKHITHK